MATSALGRDGEAYVPDRMLARGRPDWSGTSGLRGWPCLRPARRAAAGVPSARGLARGIVPAKNVRRAAATTPALTTLWVGGHRGRPVPTAHCRKSTVLSYESALTRPATRYRACLLLTILSKSSARSAGSAKRVARRSVSVTAYSTSPRSTSGRSGSRSWWKVRTYCMPTAAIVARDQPVQRPPGWKANGLPGLRSHKVSTTRPTLALRST